MSSLEVQHRLSIAQEQVLKVQIINTKGILVVYIPLIDFRGTNSIPIVIPEVAECFPHRAPTPKTLYSNKEMLINIRCPH